MMIGEGEEEYDTGDGKDVEEEEDEVKGRD